MSSRAVVAAAAGLAVGAGILILLRSRSKSVESTEPSSAASPPADSSELPPETLPSAKAMSFIEAALGGDAAAAAQFIETYNADVMEAVGLVPKSIKLDNGMACKYWVREGVKPAGEASKLPTVIYLPGLREKVFPAARLAQTLCLPEATVIIVDLPTCGGHCLFPAAKWKDQKGAWKKPVPEDGFSDLPVAIPKACELVKGLVDHLGLGKRSRNGFVLVGTSTGGHLAYTFAAKYGADTPLRGIGLIHPAGHNLADELLDTVEKSIGDLSAFPFAWESAAGCRSGYFDYLGGEMDPGDWIFAGEEYKTAAEFPPRYWQRLCEEWATDYVRIAKGGRDGEMVYEDLAPVRELALPCLVMASKNDKVCLAAKIEKALTPALGRRAEYVALPYDGGHQIHADPAKPGKNGNLHDLAGPRLAEWMQRL